MGLEDRPDPTLEEPVVAPAAPEGEPTEPAEPPVTASSAPLTDEAGKTEEESREEEGDPDEILTADQIELEHDELWAEVADEMLAADETLDLDNPEVRAEIADKVLERVESEKDESGEEDPETADAEKKSDKEKGTMEGFVDSVSGSWRKMMNPIGKFAMNSLVKTAEKQARGEASILDSASLFFVDIALRVAVGKGGKGVDWLAGYTKQELDAVEAVIGMKVARDNEGKAKIDGENGAVVDWVKPDPEMLPAYNTMDVFTHVFGYSWETTAGLKDVGRATTYKEFKEINEKATGKTKERFDALTAKIDELAGEEGLDEESSVVAFIEENTEDLKKLPAAPSYDEVVKTLFVDLGITAETSLADFDKKIGERYTSTPEGEDSDSEPKDPAVEAVMKNLLGTVANLRYSRDFAEAILQDEAIFAKFKESTASHPSEISDLPDLSKVTSLKGVDSDTRNKILDALSDPKGAVIIMTEITDGMPLANFLSVARTTEEDRLATDTFMKMRDTLGIKDSDKKAVETSDTAVDTGDTEDTDDTDDTADDDTGDTGETDDTDDTGGSDDDTAS